MIVDSSNKHTGIVVDAITGTVNLADVTSEANPAYREWKDKRMYTANFLHSRGLLGDQWVFDKTYPSNTSKDPEGAEKLTRDVEGKNRMSPRMSALLMLDVVKGDFDVEAKAYMADLLTHNRWMGNSIVGTGVPPGSVHMNKPGYAYEDLVDVSYVKLPNGREFILAIFTNGYVEPYKSAPKPYGRSMPGMFCEDVIGRLRLDEGNPAKVIVDNESPGFSAAGVWTQKSTDTQWGKSYMESGEQGGAATWSLEVPEDGKYEICILHPAVDGLAQKVNVTIRNDEGVANASINQTQCGGQWVRLGDFKLSKGTGEIAVSSEGKEPIAADAVRAIKWPQE